MENWAVEEFSGANLGDERLKQQLIKLATRFSDKPTASIPGACHDWAETQAAYRFFEQSSEKKRRLRLAGSFGPAHRLHATANASTPGSAVTSGHDRTGLQWSGSGGAGATVV